MKHVVRLTAFVVLLALLATPFVSFAQGDPRCGGLSEADCQFVLQAAENMTGVTSFTVPNFNFHLDFNMPDEETGEVQTIVMDAAGNAAVSFASQEDGMAYFYFSELSIQGIEEPTDLTDVEIILTPTMQYVKYQGEWYGGEEETDFSAFNMDSLDLNAQLDTLGIDLTGVLTTTRGADAELHGQAMATFTTSIDISALLNALLASPTVGAALGMGDGEEAMSPEEMQMVVALLAPMLEGTSIDSEQWIGLDDGYVHKANVDVVLNLDMTMFAPEAGAITGALNLELEFADFNQPINVTVPTEYKPLDEMDTEVPSLDGLGGLGAGLGM